VVGLKEDSSIQLIREWQRLVQKRNLKELVKIDGLKTTEENWHGNAETELDGTW
jgi:hypothetical protein